MGDGWIEGEGRGRRKSARTPQGEKGGKKSGQPSDLILLSLLLSLAALGCALLYGLRVLISGKIHYLYLVQNLLLAFIPYLIAAFSSLSLSRIERPRRRAIMAAPVAVLWLLFYPNAPYIFTDFIHVINKSYLRVAPSEWLGLNALLWYDIAMTAAFAFIGHFVGLVSMWLMQDAARSAWGRRPAWFLVALAILLSGFGIYLGRFSRLNSWDVLFAPRRVIAELFDAAIEPKALLFSLVFALFVALSYGALVSFKRLGRTGTRRR